MKLLLIHFFIELVKINARQRSGGILNDFKILLA